MTLALALVLATLPAPSGAAGDEAKAADVALARAVAAHDAPAFAALLEPDAIFASAGGLSRGREAIVEAWRPYLTAGGPTLAWEPTSAAVASSGELAVTTGRFTWTGLVEGKVERSQGEYVTVWRRGEDRRWRVLLDASLVPAAALGPGLVREPLRAVASEAGDLEATLGTWRRGAEEGVYLRVLRGRGASREVRVDSAFALRRR